jgi:hypothetical protein
MSVSGMKERHKLTPRKGTTSQRAATTNGREPQEPQDSRDTKHQQPHMLQMQERHSMKKRVLGKKITKCGLEPLDRTPKPCAW